MKFFNTDVWGFEHALRGMRNPKNSWNKNDSSYCVAVEENMNCGFCDDPKCQGGFIIGENDMELAQSLVLAGNEHSKFMRMIHVSVDVDMPRYWWSEADCYKFGSKNSCSTMHKLLNNDNPITLDMFLICEEDIEWWEQSVEKLELMRKEYKTIQKTTKDSRAMNRLLVRAKRMLPEGLLQLRTWDTNYAEIRNMYFQRRNHRLKEEWVETFCNWVEKLPYAKELIMYDGRGGQE